MADSGRTADNEAILEAAGVPRTKLSGAEKLRLARQKKSSGSKVLTLPKGTTEGATGTGSTPESARAAEPKPKKRRLVRHSSVEVREGPVRMVPIEPSSTTGGSASVAPKELVATASFDAESPHPEEGVLVRKKKKLVESTPPPPATEQLGAEGVGTSVGALDSAPITLDAAEASQGGLKVLMEKLFAHHTKVHKCF